LIQKRGELTDQLRELTARRLELSQQRAQMSAEAGRLHDSRIAIIDARSAALEKELFATNDLIARGTNDQIARGLPGTPTEQFTYTAPPQDPAAWVVISRAEDAVYEAVAASTMTLLSLYVGWHAFRRFVLKRKAPALRDNSAQLAQLQQSMDVIAIEVERISEGQRFTAKLLNERGIGAGDAQPDAVRRR